MSNNIALFDAAGPKARRRNIILEISFGIVLIAVGYYVLHTLIVRGAFSAAAWQPFEQWALWQNLLLGLLNNVIAALVGMVLSMLTGILLAVGLLSRIRILRLFCQAYSAVFNSVPLLLLLFFTSLALPVWGINLPDFWFLVIALTLYSGAVVGDLLKAGILALPGGQAEAATALGFSIVGTMRVILLPQALRSMTPALVSQMVIVFKGTALAYVLGGYLELLRSATIIGEFYSLSSLQALVVAAVLFMLVNIGLSNVASAISRREKRLFGLNRATRVEGADVGRP